MLDVCLLLLSYLTGPTTHPRLIYPIVLQDSLLLSGLSYGLHDWPSSWRRFIPLADKIPTTLLPCKYCHCCLFAWIKLSWTFDNLSFAWFNRVNPWDLLRYWITTSSTINLAYLHLSIPKTPSQSLPVPRLFCSRRIRNPLRYFDWILYTNSLLNSLNVSFKKRGDPRDSVT